MRAQKKRTCDHCGNVWFVDQADLKGPGLADYLNVGFTGRGRGRKTASLHRDADRRRAQLAQCPTCGCNRFTEVAA